jgi:phosphohistidine phosphatase
VAAAVDGAGAAAVLARAEERMRLYVVRHGVAETKARTGGDEARRLTAAGRAKMRKIAGGLRALRVTADVLLTSPLPRAAETAAILAEHGTFPLPGDLPGLATGTTPLGTLRALASYAKRGDVMIVGHEPGLSRLVAVLLTGSPDGLAIELRKGGVVALELDRLAPGHATLLWLGTPRLLRRVGRGKGGRRRSDSRGPGRTSP